MNEFSFGWCFFFLLVFFFFFRVEFSAHVLSDLSKDVLHVTCTRSCSGQLSVRVGDSSRHSEKIVIILFALFSAIIEKIVIILFALFSAIIIIIIITITTIIIIVIITSSLSSSSLLPSLCDASVDGRVIDRKKIDRGSLILALLCLAKSNQ